MDHIYMFGSKATLTTKEQLLNNFDQWIAESGSHYVCVSNVHTTMMGVDDLSFQEITNSASAVVMDGKPLAWVAKLKGAKTAERITGADIIHAACLSSEKKYRHFFLGGAEGIPETIKRKLQMQNPELQVVGTLSPPFRSLNAEEKEKIVKTINEAKPDILWVGLGAPKQEKWISEHRDKVDAPIMIGVGAAFDFYAGNIPRAPHWLQGMGMEWFFRLLMDPRHLWKRYLVYNSKFLARVIPELIPKNNPSQSDGTQCH